MLEEIKGAASEFVFELYVENHYGEVLQRFRQILSPLSPDALRKMIHGGGFPHFGDLSGLKGYERFIDGITEERFFDAFYKARPDLAQILMETGPSGAEYLVRLKQHFLRVLRGERDEEPPPQSPVVVATCDACKQSWPILREALNSIRFCPFCGHGKDEPEPQPA